MKPRTDWAKWVQTVAVIVLASLAAYYGVPVTPPPPGLLPQTVSCPCHCK